MAKIKTISLALLLAAILLVVEAFLIKKATDYELKYELIYANCRINEGTVITPQMLVLKSVGASLAHKYSIQEEGLAVGKIAGTDIEKDEMVLSTKLTEEKKHDIEMLLGENGRLLAVELEFGQANAWQLQPGDYVDLIFIPARLNNPESGQEYKLNDFHPERVSKFERIRIAALVDSQGMLIKGGDAEINNGQVRILPRYVLFEVPDGTDEELALAETTGKLKISYRYQ
ncbi:MAG: SAF domain-containing protein [Eubacteriales bacterium]|nr:SAF domain-containing protein [Eubacteriales bacterium]